MEIGLSTVVQLPFAEAVERTRAALAEQGFGILTEIDVKATLKAKIDQDIEDYVILGACNPPLAHRALGANRQIGLLLPCNVVVRSRADGASIVEAMNPQVMVDVTGTPELCEVADEATARLKAAIAALT